MRRFKAECRERWDLGYKPVLASIGGVLWGSWAKARLVNSNQKNRGLVSPVGVLLIQGENKGKAMEGRGDLITRAVGEVIPEFSICL